MPLAMMRTRAASPHAEGLQRGLRALIQADVVPAVYAEDLNPVGAGAIGGLALDEPTARKVAEIEAEASHGLRGVRLGQRAEAEVQVNEPLLDAPLKKSPPGRFSFKFQVRFCATAASSRSAPTLPRPSGGRSASRLRVPAR